MMCIRNAPLAAAMNVLYETAERELKDDPNYPQIKQWVASTLATLMYSAGMMTLDQKPSEIIPRLRAGTPFYDVLNKDHLNVLYDLLREMFSGVAHDKFVIIAIGDEQNATVVPLWPNPIPAPEYPVIQQLLRAVADTPKDEGTTIEL